MPDPATAPVLAAWDDLRHVHAGYPDAQATLCGVRYGGKLGRDLGCPRPTCRVCLHVAEAWDRVDGCAPGHWFTDRGAETSLSPPVSEAELQQQITRDAVCQRSRLRTRCSVSPAVGSPAVGGGDAA